jgi:hypothetical protein
MSDHDLEQLLDRWHLKNTQEGKTVRRLFDDYSSFIAYLDRIHRLSGGRRDGFAEYIAGLPMATPAGWMPQTKLVRDAFSDAYASRVQREELPVFAYLQAGFQFDPEYTPGENDGGWTKVKHASLPFLEEAFANLPVDPRVLRRAVRFDAQGVSADFARNITNGVVDMTARAKAGWGPTNGRRYIEADIVMLFHNGVPWTYANAFARDENPPWVTPSDIPTLFEAGVSAEYAVAAGNASVPVEAIVSGWEQGIAIEYLTA